MRFNVLPEIIAMRDMFFDPFWALNFHHEVYHELLHIIKGSCDLILEDGTTYHGEPSDSFIIPANAIHKDSFDLNEDLEIFLVHFSWDLLPEYNKVVKLDNMNCIGKTAKDDLKRAFDQMRFDGGSDELDKEIANSRLLTTLLLIYRAVQNEGKVERKEVPPKLGKSRRKWLVSETKRYLDKHFHKPIQLIDIAESMNVSPFYLSRVFAQESDFSMKEYLTDIRINTAKELLLDGRYIIADIATMVGYMNANYFSKVFKQKVGCTPSEYISKK